MRQKGQAAVIVVLLLAGVIGYLFFSGIISLSSSGVSFNAENFVKPSFSFSGGSCGSPESVVKT